MSSPSPAPARLGGDRCPGALRLHEAADGLLARIRLPGGLLTADQVDALAGAARHLGDGHLGLTTRGNVELRGISAQDEGRLAAVLADAGLLPTPTHERVRNVVISPAAGLDAEGVAGDLTGVVRELDALLCGTPRAADLSGRFLFALDDGRGDMPALDPDLAARWISPDLAELLLDGVPTLLVPVEAVPRVLVAAAVAFLDARDAHTETGWRFADLTHRAPVLAAVVDAVLALVPSARPVPGAARVPSADLPAPGPLGEHAAHLLLRLGSAHADTWAELARASRTGDGLVRTTPARGVVVAGLTTPARDDLLSAAAGLGLVADADAPYVGVSACTGLPGCARSHADVRSDLAAALAAVTHRPGLPVHVSGCDRRCGHPRTTHREAVATGNGYATGTADGSPATGTPLPAGRDDLIRLLTA